jgi:hypothetical protein
LLPVAVVSCQLGGFAGVAAGHELLHLIMGQRLLCHHKGYAE